MLTNHPELSSADQLASTLECGCELIWSRCRTAWQLQRVDCPQPFLKRCSILVNRLGRTVENDVRCGFRKAVGYMQCYLQQV